jgi:hypothetical protein
LRNLIKESIILDKIYEFSLGASVDSPPSLFSRLVIALYIIFSPRCARKYLRLEATRKILRSDFFPPVPELEDSIMELISTENVEILQEDQSSVYEVSFRGWVITGFVVLISLVTSLFGIDLLRVIPDFGSSFLIPIGITIGVIVTVYGALFIGSHLKELSDRFGLH